MVGVYFENSRNARIQRAGFRFAQRKKRLGGGGTKVTVRSVYDHRKHQYLCIQCHVPSGYPMMSQCKRLHQAYLKPLTMRPHQGPCCLSITFLLPFIPCQLYLFRRWSAAATVDEDVLLLLVVLWLRRSLNIARQRHNLKS